MKIAINAGHTLTGSGSGADYKGFNESKITREVTAELIAMLKAEGHTVIDATVNKAESQRAYLKEACRIANGSHAELFLSIHCNASILHTGHGVEAWTWKGKQLTNAVQICSEISRLGLKNRGVKNGSALYVVKNTTMQAILVEMFFLDNELDRAFYEKNGAKGFAQAIYNGLVC